MTTEPVLFDSRLTPIDRFRGPWRFLSNFFDPAVLNFEGAQYPTSEHAFNAAKTLDPLVRAWIGAAPTPAEAKKRGNDPTRTVLRPDWNQSVRFEVMAQVLHAKFTAHPARSVMLLSTGERELVEGNTWCDITWGRCSCHAHAWTGQNQLGIALMRLRAELRNRPNMMPSGRARSLKSVA